MTEAQEVLEHILSPGVELESSLDELCKSEEITVKHKGFTNNGTYYLNTYYIFSDDSVLRCSPSGVLDTNTLDMWSSELT